MDLHLYTFKNREGDDDSYSTQDYFEGKEYARNHKLEMIDNTFEWADSEPTEDFTGREDAEPCDDECPACSEGDHGACERSCHETEDSETPS